MIHALLAATCILFVSTANAAIYYVDDVLGNDANSGTSASPYKTIKRGTQSPTAPGDTIIVKAGTYTASDIGRSDIALWISASQGSVAGTAGAPITIMSETPLAAVIKIPSINGGSAGITISQPYYIIDGFDINGTGIAQSSGASASQAGVTISANGVIIRHTHIHDIAQGMCNSTAFGQSGILITNNISGTVIEYSIISAVGRLRLNESGCSVDKYQHDHGIYNAGGDNTTVHHNVFFGIDRGYAYHEYASGTDHINNVFDHNTVDNGSPDSRVTSTIILCQTLTNSKIRNNVFYRPANNYPISWCPGTTATGLEFKNNITNVAGTDGFNPSGKPSSGLTSSGNQFSKTLGFVSTTAGSENYSLTSSSQAQNIGLSLGYSYCGAAPDAGAFEYGCTVLSASVSGTTLEGTLESSSPPIQLPSSAGWSFSCTGVGCTGATLGSVSLKSGSDSVVSLSITGLSGGACNASSTYTVSYDSTAGSATDSINVGGYMNQKIPTFTSFAVTNNCSGTPPSNPGSPFAYYPLDGNVQDASGNSHDATQNGGTFVSAKYGQGYKATNGLSEQFTIPYGNGINIGTQSITLAMGINVPAGDVGLVRNYLGTESGNGAQRLYVLSRDGTWGVVVQDDGAGWVASDLTVEPGWNFLVLTIDAVSNTATLCKNGVTGTSGNAVNSYTDHVLPSNISIGNPPGFLGAVASGATYDEVRVWTSVQTCSTIWQAWQPPVTLPGTHNQVAHRFQYVYTDGSGNPVNLGTAINQNQIVTRSGGVAVEFQVDCANITDCTAASYRLWYSFDGVNFSQPVPDIPAAEGLYMWGNSSDRGLNNLTVTCPLTGALACTDGGTVMTSRATTPVNLTKNTSYVVRFIVKTAWATWTDFYLQLRHQDGTMLSSYTPTNGAHMIMHDTYASGP